MRPAIFIAIEEVGESVLRASKRMQGLCSLCQGAKRVIDVGCDHAQLCALLVSCYGVTHAYASDIRPGPLENAARTIRALGLEGRVEPVLRDGLDGFGPADADTIIIAGMGGDEIIAILQRAPWTKDGRHRLVLQPMTAGERLRRWLVGQGYSIEREIVIKDAGKVYAAMNITAGIDKSGVERYEYLFSTALMGDPLWPEYKKKLMQKYRVSAEGQKRAGKTGTAEQRAYQLLLSLEDEV